MPAPERASRLAGFSAVPTPKLRDSVELLLASDERTADPLLSAVSEAAESLLTDHQDRLVGTRIGHYRIVSVLGHGGMSTVYRAERDDAKYQQTVAVKGASSFRPAPQAPKPPAQRASYPCDVGASLDRAPDRQRRARRRHAIPGDGARRWRGDRLLLRQPHAVHTRTAGDLRSGLRGGAIRAPEPGRASRHQGREHPGEKRRHAEAPRLRHREITGTREPVAHRARDAAAGTHTDPRERGSRAGLGTAHHHGNRYLWARRVAVSALDRPVAL